MNKKLMLDHWSAIELFCRIIEKYSGSEEEKNTASLDSNIIQSFTSERSSGKTSNQVKKADNINVSKITLGTFNKTTEIKSVLVAMNERLSSEIVKSINKNISVKFVEKLKRESFLRDLKNSILGEYIFFFSLEEYETIKHYLGLEDIKLFTDTFAKKWDEKNKQREFEGRRLYLYHFDYYDSLDKNKLRRKIPCVIRSVVKLNEFLNLEIESLEPASDFSFISRNYSGRFTTYNEEETYLHFSVYPKNAKGDVHMLFYIGGNDEFELTVGQLHSVGNKGGSLFSREVLLDSKGAIQRGSLSPKVFRKGVTEEWNQLPEYVRKLFNERVSVIHTPVDILNEADIDRLIHNRNYLNLVDHNSLSNNLIHNEADIRTLRSKFYLYYSTSTNFKEEKDNVKKLFWNCTVLDFSEIDEVGRLKCKSTVFNIRKDNKFPVYDVEMFRPGLFDPIIIHERSEGSNEPATIILLAPMPTNYDGITFGVCFHDDWSKDLKLSPVILSAHPQFGVDEPRPLNHEEALQAQNMWNIGYLKHGKFTILEEYK